MKTGQIWENKEYGYNVLITHISDSGWVSGIDSVGCPIDGIEEDEFENTGDTLNFNFKAIEQGQDKALVYSDESDDLHIFDFAVPAEELPERIEDLKKDRENVEDIWVVELNPFCDWKKVYVKDAMI